MAKKSLFIITAVCLVISSIWIVLLQNYYHAYHVDIQGTYLIRPLTLKNFSLQNNKNKLLTHKDLYHHWTLIYFGYTHCNTVCPMTLRKLSEAYNLLRLTLPRSELPDVWFISLDPARDSDAGLNNFISAFNTNFIAAKTSLKQTKELQKMFHIESIEKNNNLLHSPEVILVNPKAEIQAYFSYPINPRQLRNDYVEIIKRSI